MLIISNPCVFIEYLQVQTMFKQLAKFRLSGLGRRKL